MLHTKFQGKKTISSAEEDFLRVLSYMGMWSCDPEPEKNVCFPIQCRLHMKYVFNWPSDFREEDV